MPTAPTAITEPFVSCVNLDGTLGGVDGKVEDGGFKIKHAKDPMTNNKDKGWTSNAPTTKTASFDLKFAWTSATGLKPGSVYPLLINVATMPTDFTIALVPVSPGPAFAGNVRIDEADAPALKVDGGFHLSLTGESEGECGYSF